jgi:hypothetical protein
MRKVRARVWFICFKSLIDGKLLVVHLSSHSRNMCVLGTSAAGTFAGVVGFRRLVSLTTFRVAYGSAGTIAIDMIRGIDPPFLTGSLWENLTSQSESTSLRFSSSPPFSRDPAKFSLYFAWPAAGIDARWRVLSTRHTRRVNGKEKKKTSFVQQGACRSLW